jgi:hypothetical protein
MSALAVVLQPLCLCLLTATTLTLDERPAGPDEWGYHPAQGESLEVTPPGFSWRPQKEVVAWEIECGRGTNLNDVDYHADSIRYNVHCPARVFAPGQYTWHYRGCDKNGKVTAWSTPRTFTIAAKARSLPMPPREELLGRIAKSHPRIFFRPEDLPRLRELARGPLKDSYAKLVVQCDKYLRNPPPTAEPLKYDDTTPSRSEPWRERWWGNRMYTIAALDGAAILAFTYRLGGKEEYGQLARRILMDCSRWDPKGATGYRYNDEAGMPYASRFSRAYSFVNNLLTEDERQVCRRVMKIRGDEMFNHLYPRHLWSPYASHSNRAWHFLGEVGVSFLGEVEGADEWVWFAMNVFFNVYPVWSDDDGGWHEGNSYWSSYISRFTRWADIMRSAMSINAYDKPYFSKIGYYPLYLMPPNTVGGGFGDLCGQRKATDNRQLVSQLAAQANNGHWQWYVDQLGGTVSEPGYVGFLRGSLPKVQPVAPDNLPSSRVFRGTGQACLNTDLKDAKQSVQVNFKSSPFGTQSHGYDANNSFLLWAYGQRLLVSSGWRDIYGSEHHRDWMWSTRSVNNITVNGQGQLSHSVSSQGKITHFAATPNIDAVSGEAGQAYRSSAAAKPILDRFTRTILFVKPELVVVFDRLEAPQPSTYQYWLHAVNEMKISPQGQVQIQAGDVLCDVAFLMPQGLTFRQTDQYDPNPRPRVKLREWHLTAETPSPAKQLAFVTLYRPHRKDQSVPQQATLKPISGGYILSATVSDGSVRALLPTADGVALNAEGLQAKDWPVIERRSADGKPTQVLRLSEYGVK